MKPLDFMIIGAQKAGTTALGVFLDQHPDIQMAKGKEVHLFDSSDYNPEWSVAEINRRYEPYFSSEVTGLKGEATPVYLYLPEVVAELYRYNPNLKLIISLRDPAERALSHYMMEMGRGRECLPFWKALLCERSRLKQTLGRNNDDPRRVFSYIDRGRYSTQIETVRAYFPDNQLLIIEMQELLSSHDQVLKRVFEFLGVSPTIKIPAKKVFSGGYFIESGFTLWILRLYFKYHNVKLSRILYEMRLRPKWSWL